MSSRYIMTDLDSTRTMGAAPTLGEARDMAQEIADREGQDVYITWNGDDGGTRAQRIETHATAEELETWAMNNADMHDEYFAPTYRTTQKRYDAGNTEAARENAERKARNMMQVAATRYNHERAGYGGSSLRFSTDAQREAAQSIADYIMEEIENGNRY